MKRRFKVILEYNEEYKGYTVTVPVLAGLYYRRGQYSGGIRQC